MEKMDRALLLDLNDFNNYNVQQLLSQAEALKLRMPDIFDGWYVAGMCYYKLGDANEALYNLSMAYEISPDERVLSYIKALNGKVEKSGQYRLLHNIKVHNGIVLTIFVFILAIAFLITLAAR